MTVLHLADEGEAADLAAFLSRLLHYDRSAAVRLQAAGTALAVFGRPPSFEVLAVRAVRLAKPYENGLDDTLDVTVSAGELLESVDEQAATSVVPGPDALRALVAAAVAEFRTRMEELTPEDRTRAELDRVGREIWSRTVGETGLPVRAVHAAQSLGFLRTRRTPPGSEAGAGSGAGLGEDAPKLLSSGAWLRLRTPFGSVALRRAGTGALGISVR